MEELPELKSLVVVDNTSGSEEFRNLLQDARCIVDFREIFEWHESAGERKALEGIQNAASNNDVINLQFTRYESGLNLSPSLTEGR